jgi:hypothetical protein
MAIIGSWINPQQNEESHITKFGINWPTDSVLENVYYVLESFHVIRRYDPLIEYDTDIQAEIWNISNIQFFIDVIGYDIEDDDLFGGVPRIEKTDDDSEGYRYIFNAYAYKNKESRDDREHILEKYIFVQDVNKDMSIGNVWEESYGKLLTNLKMVMEKRLEIRGDINHNIVFAGDNL